MANRENAFVEITPEVLLKAYACGIFPMAESAEDPALYWIEPDMRGIVPLDAFHLPARLARTVRRTRYTVWVDRDFDAVIDGCAAPQPDRGRTWINARIRRTTGANPSKIASPIRKWPILSSRICAIAAIGTTLSKVRP